MTAVPAPNNPNQDYSSTINPWFIRIPVLFITGSILLVLILMMALVAFQTQYQDKIAPGVSAYGIDLGGMTREEAVNALASTFTYASDTVFTFTEADQTWQLSAQDLGVSFDVEATVNDAFAAADGQALAGLIERGSAWFNGYAVAPVIHYDQGVAAERISTLARQINQPAQDATLTLNGTEVITTPSQIGREVDVPATLTHLDSVLLNLGASTTIPLVIYESAPTIWNTDVAASQLRAALSGPLELVAVNMSGETLGPWTATVDQIASLLNIALVDNGDGTRSYQVNVDVSAFQDFLESIAPGLVTLPQNGRFHFNVNTGQLEVIRPAEDGRALNVEQTLSRLQDAIFRYDSRTVPMVFDFVQADYHNGVTASELGITQLIAEATTYYTGSPANRIHNITEGISRFDGIIIAPGQEFSFNYWLGDMSEEAGFVQSLVIQGERTVDGVGGGICQVSTTVFRAAFFGGYRIIERNSHAYRVGYYEQNAPPGLDAAIWTPDRDFRFQNDTDYHLLIEASIYPAQNAIQFRLYSTNPGRQVVIEDPIIRNPEASPQTIYAVNRDLSPGEVRQTEWAAEGADVTVQRQILDSNGNLINEDSIYTHYVPWAAMYEVAPGDSRASS